MFPVGKMKKSVWALLVKYTNVGPLFYPNPTGCGRKEGHGENIIFSHFLTIRINPPNC